VVLHSTGDELRSRIEALNVFRRHLTPGERSQYRREDLSARLNAEKLGVAHTSITRSGGANAPPEQPKALGKDKKRYPKRAAPPATRAKRQQKVVELKKQGATVREIAAELDVSVGTVDADINAAKLEAERKAERAAKVEAKQTAAHERATLSGQYSVLLADPPWQYDNSGFDDSAASHYPTMATEDICRFEVNVDGVSKRVPDVATDAAVLFLWATNPLLPEALQVMAAWGFTYKSNYCWVKDRAGQGFWARGQHELLLIGVRGSLPPVAAGIRASVLTEPRTEHSRKPEAFYRLIEGLYPQGRYAELFGRQARKGWDVCGNEV
jgi:N6-adenosine-specific RNA methylase IME4/DNA-binding CsgD family transcriptional regulator